VSTTTAQTTELGLVAEINEGAKAILGFSHQVNLRALDAIVRSIQAGSELHGFSEVSSQMREWSRQLHQAVEVVSGLSAKQIQLVSRLLRQRRMAGLMAHAARGAAARSSVALAVARAQTELEAHESELRNVRRSVTRALEDLQQLGLMASVLACAALIEAAGGNAEQRRDLSDVSKGFSEQSEQVNQAIRSMLASSRKARR
jgi:hypothetical protein